MSEYPTRGYRNPRSIGRPGVVFEYADRRDIPDGPYASIGGNVHRRFPADWTDTTPPSRLGFQKTRTPSPEREWTSNWRLPQYYDPWAVPDENFAYGQMRPLPGTTIIIVDDRSDIRMRRPPNTWIDKLPASNIPPIPQTQKSLGGWSKIPHFMRGFSWLKWLIEFMEWYYEYLNSIYGAKYNKSQGWIINCGAAGGGVMVGGSTPCGPAAFIAGPDYRSSIGHAELVFGNWWVHFRDPTTEIQWPGDVLSHTVTGAMFKPDTGLPESPYPYAIDDPYMQPDSKFDIRPKPKSKPRERPYNPGRSIDPWTIPMGRAEVEYDPVPHWLIPYRTANPYYSPVEQTVFGPAPVSRRERVDRQPPKPGVLVDPADPYLVPNPTFVVDPAIAPHVFSYPAATVKFKRPGPRVKEAKTFIAAAGVPLRILNITTEFEDFIDALWKSIPFSLRYDALREQVGPVAYNKILAKRIKERQALEDQGLARPYKKWERVTPQQKLRDIWNAFDYIDMNKFIKNLTQNEIGDRIGGAAGRASRKAAQDLRLTKGIQLGPSL